jgi:hypothetical protein
VGDADGRIALGTDPLIQPKPLDCRIEIRGCQMGANNIEYRKLLFERSKNGRRAQFARVRKRLLFHGQIPDYPNRSSAMAYPPWSRDWCDIG